MILNVNGKKELLTALSTVLATNDEQVTIRLGGRTRYVFPKEIKSIEREKRIEKHIKKIKKLPQYIFKNKK